MNKKAAVLFSGGIDSSLSACYMAEACYDIDILNYATGTLISKNLHRIRYEELKQNFCQIKNLVEKDISGLVRKIALATMEKDILKYSVSLICLGCRLAMHTQTIIHCKVNNIETVADGATMKQCQYSEQTSTAINLFKEFYKSYGISYVNPIYNLDKNEVKYKLFENGISIQSLEDTCMFGNTFSIAKDIDISNYIEEKFDICHEYINKKINSSILS